MRARIKYGNGKINKINVVVECNNYVELVKAAYNTLLHHQDRFSDLDDELIAWYDEACQMQSDLVEEDYFDIDMVNFTEESAKAFLNKRNGANGVNGFNYSIIE